MRCRRGSRTSRAGRSARWRSTKSCARTSGTTSSSATPSIFWQTSLLEPVGGMDNFFKGFLRQPLRAAAGTHRRADPLPAPRSTGDRASRPTRSRSRYRQRRQRAHARRPTTASRTIPMPIFKTAEDQPAGGLHGGGAQAAGAGGRQGRLAGRALLGNARTRSTAAFPGPPTSITQIWYPSSGYLSRQGRADRRLHVRRGAPSAFNAQPVAERLRIAKEQGEQAARRLFANTSSTASRSAGTTWSSRAFGWADETDPDVRSATRRCCRSRRAAFTWRATSSPISSGWQEGALLQRARRGAARSTGRRNPATRRG